jgi:hypothetical protein
MRGNWWMTKPPEVRAELANLGVLTADFERPVVPVRVNSRRALLSILPLSVMEIKRGVRERQGDFEVNGGRQPALFTHCAPGADQSRVEENILAPDRHREWP